MSRRDARAALRARRVVRVLMERLQRLGWAWLALAAPLLAVKLLVLFAIGYYTAAQFAGDAATAIALCVLLCLGVRWRIAGALSRPLALLVYGATLLIEVAEAISYYFQAASFNARFFANVRLTNLRSGLDAFPVLLVAAVVLLGGAVALAGWLLGRDRRPAQAGHGFAPRYATVAALLAVVVFTPSAWHRFAQAVTQGNSGTLATSAAGRALAAKLGTGTERGEVRATAGENLVIVYMESLERIYTDNRIFPGLTPNLDRWRARGLDFAGFETFKNATFTIAGLFASQCGIPFFTTPSQVLDFTGDDANATSFQPNLACLGDVLHAAGYDQVYMNGAPLSFADKGAFFRMHGFDRVLGLDELQAAAGGKLSAPGWGLYDSDLFKLAAAKFDQLAAAGKPFNLELLTLDTHPPSGRPSPDCPKYAANANSTLQSVHCTDYLVGRFLETLSRNPAWKDTIVVVMSDHQAMRNDAWPLYPKSYQRRPLLFVLNAGQGRRGARFYHMDIAPTLLHLMDVRTNATFIAGVDRSAPDAPGSPFVNQPLDAAVMRHAVWARAQPVALCRGDVLLGPAPDGFTVGGHDIPLSRSGAPLVALESGDALAILIGKSNVVGIVADASKMPARLRERGPSAALLIQSLAGNDPMRQFALTWVGANGARAALGDAPSLNGLTVSAPQCAALVREANAAPAGETVDWRGRFAIRTAPLYPALPRQLPLTTDAARAYERGLGWIGANASGSWTSGDAASLGFTLPAEACRTARLQFSVQPFLTNSRPSLDVRVLEGGRLLTTWRFTRDQAGQVVEVAAPVAAKDEQCRADLRFEFQRPGARPPPYPSDEDPRPLQLDFKAVTVISLKRAAGTRCPCGIDGASRAAPFAAIGR